MAIGGVLNAPPLERGCGQDSRPERLWLKGRKSQASLLKQMCPKSIGFPGAFGFQVEMHRIFENLIFNRDL